MAGTVSLSLQNALATEEQLALTPSGKDNISRQLEMDLRIVGCHLIQSAGYLLKL